MGVRVLTLLTLLWPLTSCTVPMKFRHHLEGAMSEIARQMTAIGGDDTRLAVMAINWDASFPAFRPNPRFIW
jgi:hypothetical protein